MRVTASQFRADLDRLVDQVIATGEPLEIDRNGTILRLVPPVAQSWLDRLPRREGVVNGDPEDLVHNDGSDAWSPEPM